MSYPQVRGTATGASSANTSINVPLPTGYQVGDLLIVFAAMGSTPVGFSAPAGWTELSSSQAQMRTYWKIADGSEGTFLDIGNLLVKRWAGISYAVYDYVGVTPIESAQTLGTANPPSLSPSWGSANETLWITFAGTQQTDNDFQLPVGYSSLVFAESITNNSSNSYASAASARRELTAATEDPSDMYLSGTLNTPVARTIAIRGSLAPTDEISTDLVEFEFLSSLTNSLTSELLYSVAVETPVTKSIMYAVLTEQAATLSEQYTLVTSHLLQETVEYQVVIEYPVTKSTMYTVVAPVFLTKVAVYGIVLEKSLVKQLKYNIIPKDPYCHLPDPYSDMDSVYSDMTSPYTPAEDVCTGFENVCGI